MFIMFSVLGVVWTLMVIRGKQDSHKIHYLMIVLVAFKSLTLLSQVLASVLRVAVGGGVSRCWWVACRDGASSGAVCCAWRQLPSSLPPKQAVEFACLHSLSSQAFMYHTTSIYGDAEGWNIAFYIFTACRSLLFFLVVILLATGGRGGGGGLPVPG